MENNGKIYFSSALKQAMPKQKGFELNDKNIQTLTSASQVALAVVAAAGIATIALVMPNAMQVVDKFVFRRKRGRRYTREEKQRKMAETFYYLKRSGLIQIKPEKSGWRLWVTPRGKKRLEKLTFASLVIPKPENWNKKWWLVAADIPTKDHKLAADALRRKLKKMGFYPLQRTLWLYPYDPCRELDFIIRNFDIANFVTVMEVSRLDNEDDKKVTAHFRKLNIL